MYALDRLVDGLDRMGTLNGPGVGAGLDSIRMTAIAGHRRFRSRLSPTRRGQRRTPAPDALALPPAPRSASAWLGLAPRDFDDVLDEPLALGSRSLPVLRAVAAAAHFGGGTVAPGLRDALDRLSRLPLTVDEKIFLVRELSAPLSRRELVASIPDRTTAVLVYAATCLATRNGRPGARRRVAALATALHLPRRLASAVATACPVPIADETVWRLPGPEVAARRRSAA